MCDTHTSGSMTSTNELGPPPEKPLPGDCCGSGCSPCIWDTYYEELEVYDKKKDELEAASGAGLADKQSFDKSLTSTLESNKPLEVMDMVSLSTVEALNQIEEIFHVDVPLPSKTIEASLTANSQTDTVNSPELPQPDILFDEGLHNQTGNKRIISIPKRLYVMLKCRIAFGLIYLSLVVLGFAVLLKIYIPPKDH